MSFSFQAKEELCRIPVSRRCCAKAEAYGILLYCNTFQPGEIRIITENRNFAARLPRLFARAFRTQFDVLPDPNESGKLIFVINSSEKLHRIVDSLGYDPLHSPVLHINFALLEEEHCRAAFLRGVFFAGGSVTDPAKRYHLELSTSHLSVSRELEVLLRELGYPPRAVSRSGSYITYFKQSDQIEDYLTMIGAPVASMAVMSAKLEKDLRNSVNRRLNCDNANLDNAIDAAQEQCDLTRRLAVHDALSSLPARLQETAALRLKYPEYTLTELAQAFDPPLTKSCLNHRLRKLKELAQALSEP